jgi:2-polyprenyl-3-methyl-5-hydroxy-6-metoxy-1,4-benzoquinol methylase
MFKRRSYKKELLDEPVIAKEKLYKNLDELEIINKYLGGHAASIKGLNALTNCKPKMVVDIGCGGGDSVKALANKFGNKVQLTGIDLKEDCIEYSKKNCEVYPNVHFRCADFRSVFSINDHPDVIHASLFFHHFTEDEIVSFLRECDRHKVIVVINDLERNPVAYYAIKFLTTFLSNSFLVRNDAPLSVLRGFKKDEWKNILEKAGIRKYTVQNCWAFRHLIIAYPNEQ